MDITKNTNPSILLFSLGFIGIASIAPLIPQLLSLQSAELPMSVEKIQIISVAQLSILLLLMIWLGSVFSKKVGLSAPVIFTLACSENVFDQLKPQILPAVVGGIAGGIFILLFFCTLSSYLPAELLSAGKKNSSALVYENFIRWNYRGVTYALGLNVIFCLGFIPYNSKNWL